MERTLFAEYKQKLNIEDETIWKYWERKWYGAMVKTVLF